MVAAKTAVAIGHLVATKALVQQHASLVTTQMIEQLAMVARHTTQIVLHMATAMAQLAAAQLAAPHLAR